MRTQQILWALAAVVGVLVALEGAARAQRTWGVHKDHFGVYTSPRKGGNPLPWKQGQPADATQGVPSGRSRSGGFLPWQQPVAPNPVPRSAAPGEGVVYRTYPTAASARLRSWSTATYVLGAGYSGGHGPSCGGYWGGYGAGYRSGLGMRWTYGPHRGRSFIFSTRRGLLGLSTGRLGFHVRW